MNYAEAIRKLRLTMCLTQSEFGNIFGVTLGTICRWELCENKPTMKKRRMLNPYFEKYKIELEIN